VGEVAVREHHPLRLAGRPRGIDDARQVAGRRRVEPAQGGRVGGAGGGPEGGDGAPRPDTGRSVCGVSKITTSASPASDGRTACTLPSCSAVDTNTARAPESFRM